jgi:hypothetical protein
LKLEEAFELIANFAKLRYKRKFHGKAIIIWKEGRIDIVDVGETFKEKPAAEVK